MPAWLSRETCALWLARTQAFAGTGWAAARRTLARLRASLSRLDVAAAAIDLADRVETCFAALRRALLLVIPKRSPSKRGAGKQGARRQGLGLTAALVWRGLAALAGIGVTAALVTGLSAPGDATALASSSPRPDVPRPNPRDLPPAADDGGWVSLSKPIPLFGLASPELAREPASHEARQTRDGSRREDILGFGEFAGDQPYLVLRLRSGTRQDDLSRPFMISLVRDAASHALAVRRTSTPAPLRTRFGQVATADTLLGDGTAERACLAFRLEAGEMPFAFSGWWCAAGKPTDRQQLACLIERLDLVNAGDDRELRTAFARTELDRQPGCAPTRLSAAGRKASWLDADGVAPTLRLKPAATEPPATTKPARDRGKAARDRGPKKQDRTAALARSR